jgi:hypothetical protein
LFRYMSEPFQLPDKVLFITASSLAIIGLAMLFLVAPNDTKQRYVLRGTVIERHGSTAIVLANVTVIGRNLSGTIEREVFWDGNRFIALTQARE